MLKEDTFFKKKQDQAQSKCPFSIGLVYFQSLGGLRLLLVVFVIN